MLLHVVVRGVVDDMCLCNVPLASSGRRLRPFIHRRQDSRHKSRVAHNRLVIHQPQIRHAPAHRGGV
eukprot:6087148-Lingulodinium_polyedra.AAC.1